VFGLLHMSKWPDISKSKLVDERIGPRHSREAGIAAPDLTRRAWPAPCDLVLALHQRTRRHRASQKDHCSTAGQPVRSDA